MTVAKNAKKKRLKLLESLAAKARPEYFVPTIERLRKDLNYAEGSDTLSREEAERIRREDAKQRLSQKRFRGGKEIEEV